MINQLEPHVPSFTTESFSRATQNLCTICDLDIIDPIHSLNEDLCSCGQESDYGAHGVRDGKVFSVYNCEKCWNNKK